MGTTRHENAPELRSLALTPPLSPLGWRGGETIFMWWVTERSVMSVYEVINNKSKWPSGTWRSTLAARALGKGFV